MHARPLKLEDAAEKTPGRFAPGVSYFEDHERNFHPPPAYRLFAGLAQTIKQVDRVESIVTARHNACRAKRRADRRGEIK